MSPAVSLRPPAPPLLPGFASPPSSARHRRAALGAANTNILNARPAAGPLQRWWVQSAQAEQRVGAQTELRANGDTAVGGVVMAAAVPAEDDGQAHPGS